LFSAKIIETHPQQGKLSKEEITIISFALFLLGCPFWNVCVKSRSFYKYSVPLEEQDMAIG